MNSQIHKTENIYLYNIRCRDVTLLQLFTVNLTISEIQTSIIIMHCNALFRSKKIAQSELLICLLQSHTKSLQNKISARQCSIQVKGIYQSTVNCPTTQ